MAVQFLQEPQSNWAGNLVYASVRLHVAESVEQIQGIVMGSRRVKALGSRHSFSSIADTPGDLISLERLDRVLEIDPARRTVTVEAGIRYGRLCRELHRSGFALHNLASLPHISVAGACATATHGSGDGNGNLATAVSAIEMVRADGELVSLSRARDGETFRGAVVGLGALGVVTRLTLDILPAFEMRQVVYEDLPLAQLEEHFDEIFASAYSVSLFSDWRRPGFTQVWLKERLAPGAVAPLEPDFFGARLASAPLHPIGELSAENCTPQQGQPGPWFERLPHFRMDFTPSSGEELQTEYLVPRRHALTAVQAIARYRERIAPLLLVSELRSVGADHFWMSPCYRQGCLAIHFTWKKDWRAVRNLLPVLEAQLAPFEARPHWGKLFALAPDQVMALYENLPAFRRLLHSYDPEGKFRNDFIDRYILSVA